MSHDFLVQMAYSTLSQCVMENSSQLEFNQYGNHYFGNIILRVGAFHVNECEVG